MNRLQRTKKNDDDATQTGELVQATHMHSLLKVTKLLLIVLLVPVDGVICNKFGWGQKRG